MPESLLRTKLFVPPPRPNRVSRPRLIKGLNQSLELGHKLTLISAPAGFGKTTLVSEWLTGNERPVAWLSLDEGDDDPTLFLAYFIAALQTLGKSGAERIAADLGEEILTAIQSSQPPPIESVLIALLNEITAISENFILVLDDYHLVDSQPVDKALTFLVERLPPQMHLVLATREDPQLPLARMRARGQLTELRVADLRFVPHEAAEFLNQAMGLNLSAEDIASLERRTEGWIAGLQLAALALQGTFSKRGEAETAGFIQAFTGSHRFVLDYLVAEVLQQQPEQVRSFLLQTSILERLTGSLCDAVTGQEDGKEMLARLERDNLFVVQLDETRQWYRYHHLFADFLRARAMEDQPHQIRALHGRASQWYEQNDLPADAIYHALAAEAIERAANLLELAWPAMEGDLQSISWLGWVKQLPDELLRARPVLSVDYVWAILGSGSDELEEAEDKLRIAEEWLDMRAEAGDGFDDSQSGMIVVDENQLRSLPASAAVARAYIALSLGDQASAVTEAQRTLDLLPEGNDRWRGIAAVMLGFAYWGNGNLEAAQRIFADFMQTMQQSGDDSGAIAGTSLLADITIAQGHLNEALRIYQQSLQLVTAQGGAAPRGTSELYAGMGELCCEQGDLEAAAGYLRKSETLGEQAMILGNEYRLYPTLARTKAALGDPEGALALLDEAERLFYRTPIPAMRPIPAMKVRLWIKQGRLAEALVWVRERNLSVDDDVSYLKEFEHITLARLFIALHRTQPETGNIHQVMDLLERLLKAAEAGKRLGSAIEIRILMALANEAQGDISAALASIERAMMLAEPEGFARIFVDEGPPMTALLREAARQGGAASYARQLLAALKKSPSPVQPLVEPLSERELDVLKLLNTELSGPEIAGELMVSLNTVRTHTKNIYNKLGVNNRRSAVRRAEELNLL